MSYRSAIATFRGHRQPHFNIIGRWKTWFTVSGILILLSLIGLFAIGLNFSIDFKGGAQLRYPNPKNATVGDVQSVLAQYGRPDAEIQVVGTNSGNSEIVIRTKSLNDLGGVPQTKFTFPDTKASVDQLRETLAEFGILQPKIKVANGNGVVVIKEHSVGASDDVTIVYRPTTDVTAAQVEATMKSLGRSGAQVTLIPGTGAANDHGTVIIRTPTLTPPPPPPTPSPSITPSTTASPSGSPGASPSAGEGPATTAPSPSSSAAAAAAVAAAPSKQAKASPKASASPQPSPTVAPSVTPSVAPSASPTGPPSAQDILNSLGKQAGVSGGDITVRELNKDDQAALIAALADQAGTTTSNVTAKNIGGDERARLLSQLADQAGIGTDEIVINDVGPTWGAQISDKAIKGLIIFLVLVTLYISFRFEWKMAVSALVALAHDLIITAGIYALVGREVTPETVIAILTILGYSLYDTVVIFDRVKENTESLALVARDGYSSVVNLSLNETLMRSVNTSLVVLLPIASLLLFGGQTLKDFAFALFIGVASGTYSSIFIAAPLLALLKEREPRYTQIRLRAARSASRGGAQPAVSTASARPGRTTGTAQRPTQPAAKPSSTKSSPAKPTAAKPTAGKSPPVAATGDGSTGNGEVAKAASGSGQPSSGSGSGARPSGARSGGSRSKSKKRTPPAKRRRR